MPLFSHLCCAETRDPTEHLISNTKWTEITDLFVYYNLKLSVRPQAGTLQISSKSPVTFRITVVYVGSKLNIEIGCQSCKRRSDKLIYNLNG